MKQEENRSEQGGRLEALQENIRHQIERNIREGSSLIVRTYSINDKVWGHLQQTLFQILEKHGKSSLSTPIYLVLKELVANGCKANQKRVFFEESGYNIKDKEDYRKGISQYRPFINQRLAKRYSSLAKERGYYVLISFNYTEDGLVIEVVNNTPIAVEEEVIMRRKLKRAMEHRSLVDFYDQEAELAEAERGEGSGLGIALSIISLKNAGLNPDLLRLITERDRTIARFEVPYTKHFKSRRSL